MKKEKKKKTKKQIVLRILIITLCILLFLCVTVVSAFFILKAQGKKKLTAEKVDMKEEYVEELDVRLEDSGKFVVYNGKRYCYNEDNINILFMGIDRSLDETYAENIGGNGQTDAIVLFVLNSSNGSIKMVNIPRDSMVDVNRYNSDGEYIGVENMQVCLAYSQGDGKTSSCENTKSAVSRLLYGIPVNAYVALDFDGISILNDKIGGVSLEVLEDISAGGYKLYKGSVVTLNGTQAESYVRSRDMSKLDSSLLRTERQKQYMGAFLKQAIAETRKNIALPVDLYNLADNYMVTDLDISSVTYLASVVIDHGVTEGSSFTIPGEMVKGEIYAEYITDDTALYELILEIFYEEA